jgi:tetratricopeptide (TPR) repeat protein
MAYHRLGHAEQARKWLAKADEQYDTVTREILDAEVFSPTRRWSNSSWSAVSQSPILRRLITGGSFHVVHSWVALAQFQILHREAKNLIEGSAHRGDANRKALQDRARQELKRRDKATADYDHALGEYPDQSRLWLARGRRFAELKRWDRADADLVKAAELNPKNPQVWRERGCVYAEFGQPEKAAADFAKALALVPDDTDPWFEPWWSDRAGIRNDLVQWDEVFDRVVGLRPRDAQLWIARANHHGRRGQWQQAATAIAKVIDLDPSDHLAWFQHAAVCLQLGDIEGYRRACREMLTRFGQTNDPGIAERIVKTCLLVPDAVSDSRLITELADRAFPRTETPGFLLVRGMIDYRDGRFDSALARFDKLLSGNADSRSPGLDAMARLFLAMARQQLRQSDAARQAFETACRLMEQKPLGDADLSWADRLRFQVARREAAALLNGTAGQKESEKSGR